MKTQLLYLSLSVLLFAFTSCDDDADTNGTLEININGLEDLGSDFAYEGWLIVDDTPVSAGIFRVTSDGSFSQTSFDISRDQLDRASSYVLTIEPSPDNDPAPSDVHILAGDFSGNTVSLSVAHPAAIGYDFRTSEGNYILATPTDGDNTTDERSGVWWLDPAGGPSAGLSLPELGPGWQYEGWAVIGGTPVTTGTFKTVSGADDVASFSGNAAGPPFPGEDFLRNAPAGLSFPTDLAGNVVVISVEPVPDNSAGPFLLKPLVGQVPASAADHTLYSMENNAEATNPTGTIVRQ